MLDQRYRDGHHFRSNYWQQIKNTLAIMTPFEFSVCIGMVLSDATLLRTSIANNSVQMKIEQGHIQEPFVLHLFSVLANWCFIVKPQPRLNLDGSVKSY